jgi:hypothetical protein
MRKRGEGGVCYFDCAMLLPSRDEVRIQSSWNPSQQSGSSPTTFDYCYINVSGSFKVM